MADVLIGMAIGAVVGAIVCLGIIGPAMDRLFEWLSGREIRREQRKL